MNNPFKTPTAYDILVRNTAEAEKQLMLHKSQAAYHKHMVAYYKEYIEQMKEDALELRTLK